ncbi:HAD family hydrolase [Methanococcoides sp. SA1]|nr:HAD family hydrolase [Methanococcoides sp. SA1]
MLQAIIFDHDGTLAQTMERQFAWFGFWAKKNNMSLPHELRSFVPFYNFECAKKGGVQNVYDALGLPCDMNDKNHPVWPAYEEFKQVTPAPLYDGIPEAVVDIWKMGSLSEDYSNNRRLRLGINTTNTWRSVHSDLKKGGILNYFDSHVTEETLRDYHGAGDPDGIKKPSKISLALALGLIDSDGAHVIHVGDTINDLAASHKVVRLNPCRPETLITVGAAWGYEGRDVLEKGAEVSGEGTIYFNHIIDKPQELVGVVGRYLK